MTSKTSQMTESPSDGILTAETIAVARFEAPNGDFYPVIIFSRPACDAHSFVKMRRILSPDEAADMGAMLLEQARLARQKALDNAAEFLGKLNERD